jgi:hypothetical protein
VRCGPGELPVLDLFRTRPLRLALTLPVGVDKGVSQDPEQPGLKVRTSLELVKRRICLRKGLLHQILGIGRIAGHPHPGRVELVQVWQHVVFEPLAALLKCLGDRTHPFRSRGLQPTCLHAASPGGYNA